jgi:hypothetical protein
MYWQWSLVSDREVLDLAKVTIDAPSFLLQVVFDIYVLQWLGVVFGKVAGLAVAFCV